MNLLILLFSLLVFPLAAQSGNGAPQESPSSACISAVLDYQLAHRAPNIHVGLYLDRPSSIGKENFLAGMKREQLNPGRKILILGDPLPLEIKRTADGYLEARDPLNERFFSVEQQSKGVGLVEITRPKVFVSDPILRHPLPRGFQLKEQDVSRLAAQMAKYQSAASATLRKEGESSLKFQNLVSANELVLKDLLVGKSVDVPEIEKINGLVNAVGDQNKLYTWDSHVLPLGVMRGMPPKIVRRNVKNYDDKQAKKVRVLDGPSLFRVDLSQAEMQNLSKYPLSYLPASQVREAMMKWMDEFNHVNSRTAIRDILSLYRRFILIHPFGDGNGRTGRVLLEAMLIRAGFGPIPSNQEFARDVLYNSLDDLEARFVQAYLPQQ